MTTLAAPPPPSVRVEHESSSAVYTEHVRRGPHRLRVSIRLNSYTFQSFGKVDRWNGEQWHTVVEMTGDALHVCRKGGGCFHAVNDATATAADFTLDRDRLLALAAEIVD